MKISKKKLLKLFCKVNCNDIECNQKKTCESLMKLKKILIGKAENKNVIVKSVKELFELFSKQDIETNPSRSDCIMFNDGISPRSFNFEMLQYCGKAPDIITYSWRDEWLKDKEE